MKLLYLHGFRSSPQSIKAQQLAAAMQERGLAGDYTCPEINLSPREVLAQTQSIVNAWLHQGVDYREISVIGSSLGGFYATWLAEYYACRCVLLNPAITPWDDLLAFVGEQPLWHGGGSINLSLSDLAVLKDFAVKTITLPQRYLLIAATGDEVLDYRTMLAHYPSVQTRLIQGGDHGIRNFADYLEEVLSFCSIKVWA
jgi:uncharacterized protein